MSKHDDPRYQAAISRRIKHNAKIGNLRRMPAEVRALADALDTDQRVRFERDLLKMDNHERAHEGLMSIEEHLEMWSPAWGGSEHSQVSHAQVIIDLQDRGDSNGGFGPKLVAAWIVFGKLSPKQMKWVRNMPGEMAKRAKAREDAQEARKGSEWVGSVGERLRGLAVTVMFETHIESEWGGAKLVKFTDGDGNEFGWFGSGVAIYDLKKGDEVILTGTVKKHDTYQGIKQTMLTRCAIQGD
jgi:hypothetical protein